MRQVCETSRFSHAEGWFRNKPLSAEAASLVHVTYQSAGSAGSVAGKYIQQGGWRQHSLTGSTVRAGVRLAARQTS